MITSTFKLSFPGSLTYIVDMSNEFHIIDIGFFDDEYRVFCRWPMSSLKYEVVV